MIRKLLPLVFTVCLFAQEPSVPSLHVEAREVVLDVTVTDAKGNIVDNLGRDEITVYEDKTRQVLRSFTPPSAHVPDASSPAVNSTADLQKIGDAPVNILVLDELDTRFEDMTYGRNSLFKYLSHQPARLTSPAMLMVADDKSLTVLHDYTQDREALISAVRHHFPTYPFRMNKHADSDTSERMALGLGSLMQIAQAAKGISGRKNIIWVGVGFPSIAIGPSDLNDATTLDLLAVLKQTTKVLTDARVTLNVIDPTIMSSSMIDTSDPDLTSPEQLLSNTDEAGHELFISGASFEQLAHTTGGFAFSLRNDVDREIASAASTGEHYYTLSYSPTNRSNDSAAFRQIHVFVSRPGLTVTTREGYYLDQPYNDHGQPSAPTTRQLAFDLTNAALNTMTFTGIPISGFPSAHSYTLEVPTHSLTYWAHENGKSSAEVTVMAVCFGEKDRVLSHNAMSFHATEPPPIASYVNITVPLDVPPTTKRVRFVVRDAVTGHLGTFDATIKH